MDRAASPMVSQQVEQAEDQCMPQAYRDLMLLAMKQACSYVAENERRQQQTGYRYLAENRIW
jgi:hypothetical protein